jgi:ribose transport system substrate-binding protein
VTGTVVQDPYRYGFESVRILAALARGRTDVLPKSAYLEVPARVVGKEDARAYRDELKLRLDQGASAARK